MFWLHFQPTSCVVIIHLFEDCLENLLLHFLAINFFSFCWKVAGNVKEPVGRCEYTNILFVTDFCLKAFGECFPKSSICGRTSRVITISRKFKKQQIIIYNLFQKKILILPGSGLSSQETFLFCFFTSAIPYVRSAQLNNIIHFLNKFSFFSFFVSLFFSKMYIAFHF